MSKSNGQQPTSHHYVPKFYLKQFSTTKKKEYHIYTLDKYTMKHFKTNINNVACEDYFYDIVKGKPDYFYKQFLNTLKADKSKLNKVYKEVKSLKDLAQLSIDEKPVVAISSEQFFSVLETEFSKVHKKIIDSEDLSQLNEYEKMLFSLSVFFQYRRTKAQRDYIEKTIRRFIIEQIGNTNSVTYAELTGLVYMEELPPFLHINAMLSTMEINLEAFLNMGWTLHTNETSLPYLTSDNPVVVDNITDFDSYKECQIQKGCKIHFPLSPKVCLFMYDSSSYEYPSKISDDNLQSVIDKNKFQVNNSMRHIFSRDNISLTEEQIQILTTRCL
jgi:predicted DNA binding protein